MAIVDEWARKKISKERKKQREELRGKVSTIFKGWRRCVFVGIGTGGWEDRFSVLFLLFLSFPLSLALCNFVFFFTLLSLHEAARLRKPTPSSSLLISHSCFFFLSLASTVVLIAHPKKALGLQRTQEQDGGSKEMRNVFVNSLLMR